MARTRMNARPSRARIVGGPLLVGALALTIGCSDDASDGNTLAASVGSAAPRPPASGSAEADSGIGGAHVLIFLCGEATPRKDGCAGG